MDNTTTTVLGIQHNEMMTDNDDDGVKIQPTFYPKSSGIDGPFRIQPKDDISLILAYKKFLGFD